MSSKYSVIPLVAAHFNTLVDANTKHRHIPDYIVSVGLPLAAGAIFIALQIRLSAVGETVSGLSVLTGLLFALVIYVFQLRIGLTDDPRVPRGSPITGLIDELFKNVCYAVVVGLTATCTIVTAANFRHQAKDGAISSIDPYTTAIIIIIVSHLLLTILMCLKRTYRAYLKLTS